MSTHTHIYIYIYIFFTCIKINIYIYLWVLALRTISAIFHICACVESPIRTVKIHMDTAMNIWSQVCIDKYIHTYIYIGTAGQNLQVFLCGLSLAETSFAVCLFGIGHCSE